MIRLTKMVRRMGRFFGRLWRRFSDLLGNNPTEQYRSQLLWTINHEYDPFNFSNMFANYHVDYGNTSYTPRKGLSWKANLKGIGRLDLRAQLRRVKMGILPQIYEQDESSANVEIDDLEGCPVEETIVYHL